MRKTAKKKSAQRAARTRAVRSADERAPYRAQILRLAATQFFPTLDEGVKELIDSLIRISKANAAANLDPVEIAERIIDRALVASPACPTPADFAMIASDAVAERPPEGCAKCDGSGRVYVTKEAIGPAGERFLADCVDYCTCGKGVFLRHKARPAEPSQMAGAAGYAPLKERGQFFSTQQKHKLLNAPAAGSKPN